jgi:thiol-disulfide isomerase/thioredoxin
MKILNKRIIIQFLIIILVILAFRAWQNKDLVNGTVPILNLQTITKDTIDSKPLADSAFLIHFWATWCRICEIENDSIQSIAKDYKTLNIAIKSGSDDYIKEYAIKNGLKLDNIINDNSGSLAQLFGVRGTPSSFIVDNEGKVQFTEVGYSSEIGLRLRLWFASL